MKLTPAQREAVREAALSQLGRDRTEGFTCVDFVRGVYASIGLAVPFPLVGWMSPPAELNIVQDQLNCLPLGELIFFSRKNDPRKRKWTHVGIALTEREIIHCSQFLGEKVVITDLENMLVDYDFAP